MVRKRYMAKHLIGNRYNIIVRHLDRILIFLGCVVIIAAISIKLYTQYEQKALVDNYRNLIMSMKDQDADFNRQSSRPKISSAESQPQSSSQSVYESKAGTETPAVQKQPANIIGVLSIPKIGLTVGVGEGVDKETIKYSVGHFTGTAMPGGKGNLCIIGHRSYTYGEFFNRLDEMKKDDAIIIESSGKTFHYKVTEILVVKPEEVSVLNQTENSEITLITCTPIRSGTNRLIVKGVLADS